MNILQKRKYVDIFNFQDNKENATRGKCETEEKEIGKGVDQCHTNFPQIKAVGDSGQKQRPISMKHKSLQQADYEKMHNAEKLVQFSDYSKKTAFQFDSLPQKSVNSENFTGMQEIWKKSFQVSNFYD